MNHILVPTDFSELSDQAMEFAVAMARYAVADVQVTHFVDMIKEEATLVTADTAIVGTTDETLFNIQLMRSNQQKLKEIMAHFADDSVTVGANLAGGGFLGGIKHYVKQHNVGAIVIGTTGKQNIEEFFSGNHTEQLIEHLDVPVISVQKAENFNEIKNVILALEVRHEHYTPAALERMKDAILNFNARIHMVSVVPDESHSEDALEQLSHIRRRMQLGEATVEVVVGKEVEAALHNHVNKINADAIAILTEAKSGLWRFVQHSLATHITKDFTIPVLTLNKKFFD